MGPMYPRNMSTRPFLLFFAAVSISITGLLTSCNSTDSSSAIPVVAAHDKYLLDDLADSIRYVLLEESSIESIAGSIFSAQIDDGKLFVAHNSGAGSEENQIISVYDLDGHYLNRIGRKGRARNEFIRVSSWCLDVERNEVLILDRSSYAIKRYDYNGTYISQIPLPEGHHIIAEILMFGGKIYGQTLLPDDTVDNLMLINDDGTFNTLIDNREIATQEYLMIPTNSEMQASDMTSLYHMRPFDRNLYKITDNNTVGTCGFFDFLKVPPASKLKSITTDDVEYFLAMPYIGPQTSDHLIIRCIAANELYVYHKWTGTCTRYNNWTDKVFVPQPIGASSNIVITKITPFNAQIALENHESSISESDKQMLQTIASRENDVLLLYHLK